MLPSPVLFAQSEEPDESMESEEISDLLDMSLEELGELEVIISASRQAQAVGEFSVPVSIITEEDIHYSGLTSIPEILQFTPGVDMLPISRVRYAVGVRGLHEFMADRTLILINGRAAESPLFGGTEYLNLPILMEDIERIEVVRGPGGAAWGANAFTGVVNIITKKPADVEGSMATTTFTEFGDSYTHARYAEKRGHWTWRFSLGYEDVKDSDKAGAGKFRSNTTSGVNSLMGFSQFEAQDHMENWRLDSEAHYDHSEDTRILLGVGYGNARLGDWEFGGYYPGGTASYETTRTFTKVEHEFDSDTTGYLQWFGNFSDIKVPSLTKWQSMQNDLEAQLTFDATADQKITVGGNYRAVRLNTKMIDSQSLRFSGDPYDEQLAGAFFIDRWTLNEKLVLEGQLRGDWYSETHSDWSTRLTSLYKLDEEDLHTVRFSFAKAFRAPFITIREVSTNRLPMGGGLYAFNVDQADTVKNEEVYSFEAGYTGKISDNLTLYTDAYLQKFKRLIGFNTTYDAFGVPTHKAENMDGATARGFETEVAFENDAGKLSVWYALNDFEEDSSRQGIRAYLPSKHKVGLRGRLLLPDRWVWNTNYKFTNSTRTLDNDSTLLDAGSFHRLDLNVTRKFADGRTEVMIGINDVLNHNNEAHFATGQLSALETPGRMLFARIQVHF